jgi:hypothetical protein
MSWCVNDYTEYSENQRNSNTEMQRKACSVSVPRSTTEQLLVKQICLTFWRAYRKAVVWRHVPGNSLQFVTESRSAIYPVGFVLRNRHGNDKSVTHVRGLRTVDIISICICKTAAGKTLAAHSYQLWTSNILSEPKCIKSKDVRVPRKHILKEHWRLCKCICTSFCTYNERLNEAQEFHRTDWCSGNALNLY